MKRKSGLKRKAAVFLASLIALASLAGCGSGSGKVKLDPKNPVTVTVWHYYNGAIMNAFDAMLQEFNDTVGLEKGIIVEGYGMGSMTELEKAVVASANKEVGSLEIPNIFASYADTAYVAEQMGILANLGDYLTEEEQGQYLDSYIEEGKIGNNGELRIFPIAKSTEIFMLNDTDWEPFAKAHNLTYDDLSTMEGVARVSALYYDWTDAQTPDFPNDGRAFFGRDVMANLFIITSKEFDTEIFSVENGAATIHVNEAVMRKIWDSYYVPYINGYFVANGRFRSDDAKVGDVLAYVGSTASISYFPQEVTVNGSTYPITAKVLPVPRFEGGGGVIVQQGAGMVVSKKTAQEEYASVEFLKWFTEVENNIVFSGLSGYMPVKKQALEYEPLRDILEQNEISLDEVTDATLQIVLEEIKECELYTNKAFYGGAEARAVLETSLQEKAVADREAVVRQMEEGISREEAVGMYDTDEQFTLWMSRLSEELEEAIR